MVDVAEAVGGVKEGHPRLGCGIAVSLGIPNIQGLFQAVALYHQGDVVPLGLAGAAGILVVLEKLPQAVGLEEGLNVAVLTVAYDEQGVIPGQALQGLGHLRIEDAAVAGHMGVLLLQQPVQQGLDVLPVQIGQQLLHNIGQQHPHTADEPGPGDLPGILGRDPRQHPVPGQTDGIHRIPQGAVQVK